jgi:DNA-binding beta-propeller fold protein YncE
MFRSDRARRLELLLLVGSIVLARDLVSTQKQVAPPNDLPSPYETVRNWGTLPPGRTWGSTGAVNIDRDGVSVWAIERCGSFSWQTDGRVSCAGSDLDPVLKFDASGKTVTSFASGRFIFPHGLHVDREGNVWVTDSRAATAAELKQFPDAKGKGHTVVKFSPEGKVLLTLGTPGVAGNPPENLNEPCDVITTPNGDILVSEGHSGQNRTPAPTTVSRISQFSSDGKFIRSWGRLGSGPGEFKTPHALAYDAQGRLYVADRGNNRVQVFDQEGKFVTEWSQFGRPSDVHVDANGVLYVADAESSRRYGTEWRRGIRIGRVSDGVVTYLIPPHKTDNPEGMSGEGIAVDAEGNVYAAEVGTDGGGQAVRGLTKHVRRAPQFH